MTIKKKKIMKNIEISSQEKHTKFAHTREIMKEQTILNICQLNILSNIYS